LPGDIKKESDVVNRRNAMFATVCAQPPTGDPEQAQPMKQSESAWRFDLHPKIETVRKLACRSCANSARLGYTQPHTSIIGEAETLTNTHESELSKTQRKCPFGNGIHEISGSISLGSTAYTSIHGSIITPLKSLEEFDEEPNNESD
jgi:hypothetical protein